MDTNIKKTAHISPLRYPGGKTSLSSFFETMISKHNLKNVVYVEPYAGGAGAALSLLTRGKVQEIIINDYDKAIYSFWKSMLEDTDKFVEKIQTVKVDIEEWHKQKEIYKNKQSSIFDKGFATFFLNRTNRSGIVEGGPIGGYDQKGKWKINARFNKKNLIKRIVEISKYRNKIIVSNKDGIDLLRELKKTNETFLYLDPPYYEQGGSLYLNHYKDKDHMELARFLNKNSDINWILTYDNNDYIKSLYKKRKITKFPIRYSVNIKRREMEVMILSDNLSLA